MNPFRNLRNVVLPSRVYLHLITCAKHIMIQETKRDYWLYTHTDPTLYFARDNGVRLREASQDGIVSSGIVEHESEVRGEGVLVILVQERIE